MDNEEGREGERISHVKLILLQLQKTDQDVVFMDR